MRKRIAAVALGLTLLGGVATAQGAPDSPQLKPYEARYLKLRSEYVKEFGLSAAGRNIVIDGYRPRHGTVRVATPGEVRHDVQSMDTALHPATTVPTTTSTSTSYTGTAASSSTVQCESGGDYGAVNPAGYYGAYQFDQSTWDAYAPAGYAGVNPASAPPGVQDEAAANVPYDAWPNC